MSCQVTVLMAVYNGTRYLRTSIDSILAQTYPDFHFLIVDDASTDDTRELVRSYDDDRIELLCLEKNVGQSAALNAGLRHAATPWIARMDDDDYSAPNRLEIQMKVLVDNPTLSCLGTYAWAFRDDPEVVDAEITTPLDFEEIRNTVLGTPIVHGTIVVNRDAILKVGGYREDYPIAADVEMYDRLFAEYKAATIPQALLGVRRHPEQRSNSAAAYSEGIQISRNRLSSGRYSPQVMRTIAQSLCRTYLFRGRYLVGQRSLLKAIGDVFHAFKVSPTTFFPQWVVVFIVYNVAARHRAKLRRAVLRLVPGFKTW